MAIMAARFQRISLVLLALLATPAHATTRTVYFNATGTNRTSDGLSEAATSTCKISISNPSSQSVKYSVSMTATDLESWNVAGHVYPALSQVEISTCSSGSCSATTTTSNPTAETTLDPNVTVTLTYKYNDFPASTANAHQDLRCSGKITATDVSQPGFLLASGILTTFVESARMQTDAVSGGSGSGSQVTFGGIAVYTQIPIPINRSKPF